jgi:hypothetical protein
MSTDAEFDPETSNLVYGPINKPRWIYACSKQLMDRVIHAYGMVSRSIGCSYAPVGVEGCKAVGNMDRDNAQEPRRRPAYQLIVGISSITLESLEAWASILCGL